MQIDVFTLFPEWFGWFESQRHVANALAAGHELRYCSYRDHTPLSAGQVDDTPFGGGAGMVLRVDVVDAALQGFYGRDSREVRAERRIVALTASGRILGRYVLAGGELAAMVVMDTVVRKLPGALGHEESAREESFSAALEGAPEYPHYTRPAEYRGWRVPEVLLSGHHERIREWRREQSRRRGQSG